MAGVLQCRSVPQFDNSLVPHFAADFPASARAIVGAICFVAVARARVRFEE